MTIKFNCPNCGARMTAPDVYAGRQGKCSKCGQLSRVPVPSMDPPPVQALEPQEEATRVVAPRSAWDTAAASLVFAGILCTLFAGCIPFAAVLGVAISAASIPVIARVPGVVSQVFGALVMLACLAWCGIVCFMLAAEDMSRTLERAKMREAFQQRRVEDQP